MGLVPALGPLGPLALGLAPSRLPVAMVVQELAEEAPAGPWAARMRVVVEPVAAPAP